MRGQLGAHVRRVARKAEQDGEHVVEHDVAGECRLVGLEQIHEALHDVHAHQAEHEILADELIVAQFASTRFAVVRCGGGGGERDRFVASMPVEQGVERLLLTGWLQQIAQQTARHGDNRLGLIVETCFFIVKCELTFVANFFE